MNKRLKYIAPTLLSACLLVSCGVVTPKYKQPKDMGTDNLFRDTTVTDTSSIANTPWRNLFSDPILQNLIQEGLDQNLDLKSSLEKMKEAKASLTQSKLEYLPSVSGAANVTRTKLSEQATQSTSYYSTTWQAGLSASWELDVWGKLNSSRKAALASYLKTDAARRAVQTELIASIATNYYTLLELDEELELLLVSALSTNMPTCRAVPEEALPPEMTIRPSLKNVIP